ncbi:hypothetical protein NHX12_018394 [Muraenolepis orangiensis]|uniref:Uncharacterized protein n=1 Tax=Muraenolepis orangiensis TaxID=630683 RepID=A0A9Q0EX53_9TELE|nr:hypothetical protein NHX12_018394 [Muraenolepis orangiensis]
MNKKLAQPDDDMDDDLDQDKYQEELGEEIEYETIQGRRGAGLSRHMHNVRGALKILPQEDELLLGAVGGEPELRRSTRPKVPIRRYMDHQLPLVEGKEEEDRITQMPLLVRNGVEVFVPWGHRDMVTLEEKEEVHG